jgi:cob(I)alamin adenosyltransferase
MSRIYTKLGDDGTTGLLYGGRTSKGADLMDALGDIDEAVSALGVARACCTDQPRADLILSLQRDLFVVAADLATNPTHRDRLVHGISLVEPSMAVKLEELIDSLTAEQPLRPVFVVPGTTQLEAAIDLARTVVRRAERHTVQAKTAGALVTDEVLRYLNRLSDLLYIMARQALEGAEELASHD